MGTTGMHADEVPTDEALVQRLIAEQFPAWADRPVTAVASSGTENALYRIGPDLAARLPRHPRAEPAIAKEATWLPRLAPDLPWPVPVPVASGAPGAGYPFPWSVCRWVAGTTPTVDDLTDPHGLAADLATLVAALRAIDPTGGPAAAPDNRRRGGPLAPRDETTRWSLAEVADEVDVDAAEAVWQAALDAEPWTGPPVWLHADLAPGNVLVDDAGRLAGVIDFGSMAVGDPACDLAGAWMLLPSDAREAFREAVGIDDAAWARGRGWALSIALLQLPYYRDTNPTLVASSRHVITQTLAG